MLNDTIKLKFTTNHVNSIDGTIEKDVDFGIVLDRSFDEITLKSNKNYSLYNGLLVDIRNERRKDESECIEVTKSDLESLKVILISAVENNSLLNRRVGFLLEVIEKAIADDIISKNASPPTPKI